MLRKPDFDSLEPSVGSIDDHILRDALVICRPCPPLGFAPGTRFAASRVRDSGI
jgi:hypothetical protein